MNRNIHRQVAEERGVDIRNPSTAYFTMTSADRDEKEFSNNFRINRNQQLIPGFFTRMAVQEVVMEYGIPNIYSKLNGTYSINTFTMSISPTADGLTVDASGVLMDGSTPVPTNNIQLILVNGIVTPVENLPILDPEGAPIDISGAEVVGEVLNITIPDGFYNVAQCLARIVQLLNAGSTGGAAVYSLVASTTQGVTLNCKKGGVDTGYRIGTSVLASALGFSQVINITTNNVSPLNPNISFVDYIDIECSQLTYSQDVKDSSTNKNIRDLLYRWYFGWSGQPQNDAYGYPILQTYQPFMERRNIAFPKQIKWNPLQSVGVLQFNSFLGCSASGYYDLVPLVTAALSPTQFFASGYEFAMSLLLSEV